MDHDWIIVLSVVRVSFNRVESSYNIRKRKFTCKREIEKNMDGN